MKTELELIQEAYTTMLVESNSGMQKAINVNNDLNQKVEPKDTDIVNSGSLKHKLTDVDRTAHSANMLSNFSVETNYDGNLLSYSGKNSDVVLAREYHNKNIRNK